MSDTEWGKPDDKSKLYAIAHPVRTRYSRMLDAEGDIMMAKAMASRSGPGGGIAYFQDEMEATVAMTSIQGQIVGGYFETKDFSSVYPDSTPQELPQYLISELSGLGIRHVQPMLFARKVQIKTICEINNWFEELENTRRKAADYPTGKRATAEYGDNEWLNQK